MSEVRQLSQFEQCSSPLMCFQCELESILLWCSFYKRTSVLIVAYDLLLSFIKTSETLAIKKLIPILRYAIGQKGCRQTALQISAHFRSAVTKSPIPVRMQAQLENPDCPSFVLEIIYIPRLGDMRSK